MAARQAREIELSIFIGPTDPCFPGGSLDHAQGRARNRRALSCAHDTCKAQFNRSNAANLLENTSHAPLSPMKIPFARSRSSTIRGPKKAAVLPPTRVLHP